MKKFAEKDSNLAKSEVRILLVLYVDNFALLE